ncbi:MAG: acyl-CoA thioesterase [Candidatus Omnitrophica bacterium]|nr:acyl-CoA thioesterase [Candidatus Omnitrophota bacterium]
MFGNVYFARYFEWQGMAREEFFKHMIQDKNYLMQNDLKLITVTAHVDYKNECFLYDDIDIAISVSEVTLTTAKIEFVYKNVMNDKVVAMGYQKIGFADKSGNIVHIPVDIVLGAKDYVKDSEINDFNKILSKLRNI